MNIEKRKSYEGDCIRFEPGIMNKPVYAIKIKPKKKIRKLLL